MGKFPPYYSDSEETEATSASSVENVKKKKKLSILKRSSGSIKKKKCKLHTKSEPEDSDFRSRSRSSIRSKNKPRGILKYDREKESTASEEEDSESNRMVDRCLVGKVPRPTGAKPGRGGGVSIIVRRNVNSRFQGLEPQVSTSSNKRRKHSRQLSRKRSY